MAPVWCLPRVRLGFSPPRNFALSRYYTNAQLDFVKICYDVVNTEGVGAL